MLIQGSKIIGLSVFTLDKGKKIEEVEDLIYDPKENKVLAFLIQTAGFLSEAKVIPLNNIVSIGTDAVVITTEGTIKSAAEVGDRVARIVEEDTFLTKTRVITERGTDLGRVSDLFFDSTTGKVEEFEVSQGFENLRTGKKRVKIYDIITVGEDATIVNYSAEKRLTAQAERGGVVGAVRSQTEKSKGLLDSIGETLSNFSQKATTEVKDLVGRAEERIDEERKPKGKISEIKRKGKRIYKSLKKSLEEERPRRYAQQIRKPVKKRKKKKT